MLVNKDSFSNGQIASKIWLCQELEKLKSSQENPISTKDKEEFKTNLDWAIKEFFVHYDINKVERGREHYHVKEYQAPEEKYVDVNTTTDTPEESLKHIKDYL